MSQDVILDAILSSEGQSAAKIEYKETRFSEDYLILSDGRLYSRASRRFLTPKLNNVGYYEYVISRKKSSNGKALGTVQQAHRLVAEAFIPNPDNLPYVHHINENKLDNSVDNLQWVSAAYNSQEHLKKNLPKKRRSKEKYVCGESDLENEKWVSVKDFPNYMISNMGRIRNTKGGWFVQPDIPKDVDTGYARITLRRDGKNHIYFNSVSDKFAHS